MLRPTLCAGMLVFLHTTAHASDHHKQHHQGAVYTLTNESDGNRVLAFERDKQGLLSAPVSVATEGLGSGDGLGSQGALVISENQHFLLTVNAGSNDISVFALDGDELTLRSRVPSGGNRPISITEQRNLVFVLNAGDDANVSGFLLDARGQLRALPNATAALRGGTEGAPAQVQLTPDARTLIVAEKAANQLETFRVTAFGRLGASQVTKSAGMTPFGFDVSERGYVVVSEAGTASASSYDSQSDGSLSLVSGVVPDKQQAPCWVTITPDERHVFVGNAGSGSVSSYTLGSHGELALTDERAGVVSEEGHALDLAITERGNLLFALDRGRAVVAFALDRDGKLSKVSEQADIIPEFSAGIAAY